LGQLFDLNIESHDKLFHLSTGAPARVEVVGACYSYGDRKGVADCHLTLAAGESVALFGAPGTGKSTLVDLLCGVRTATEGHVRLDGIDIRELRPDSLREHLAVARGVEIFHGSIDENVHLHRPNIQANDVRDALKSVGLLDEILTLPDGLNTVLQTNGSPLTSSQATRLMVARAIVGRPRLLLIDGTLDSLPDHLLREVLGSLLADDSPWTLLVVTGRRYIQDACDRTVDLRATAGEASRLTNV
jgi:ABC-type bacteriocin/lantibiotic exporter with double-glycine peptidase domain